LLCHSTIFIGIKGEKLALRIFFSGGFLGEVLGAQDAGRNDVFEGVVDLHFKEDHIPGRDHDQEAGGRGGSINDKDIDQFLLRLGLNLGRGVGGDEAERPNPFARVLDQAGPAEFFRPFMGEKDLVDLLGGRVDVFDNRDVQEKRFAEFKEPGPDDVRRKIAGQENQRDDDDKTEQGNRAADESGDNVAQDAVQERIHEPEQPDRYQQR